MGEVIKTEEGKVPYCNGVIILGGQSREEAAYSVSKIINKTKRPMDFFLNGISSEGTKIVSSSTIPAQKLFASLKQVLMAYKYDPLITKLIRNSNVVCFLDNNVVVEITSQGEVIIRDYEISNYNTNNLVVVMPA
jgi:hypothetical protein